MHLIVHELYYSLWIFPMNKSCTTAYKRMKVYVNFLTKAHNHCTVSFFFILLLFFQTNMKYANLLQPSRVYTKTKEHQNTLPAVTGRAWDRNLKKKKHTHQQRRKKYMPPCLVQVISAHGRWRLKRKKLKYIVPSLLAAALRYTPEHIAGAGGLELLILVSSMWETCGTWHVMFYGFFVSIVFAEICDSVGLWHSSRCSLWKSILFFFSFFAHMNLWLNLPEYPLHKTDSSVYYTQNMSDVCR